MMDVSNNTLLVSIPAMLGRPVVRFLEATLQILSDARNIEIRITNEDPNVHEIRSKTIIDSLQELASILATSGHGPESEMLEIVVGKSLERKELGGLGLDYLADLGEKDKKEVLFLVEAWSESLNSEEKARNDVRRPLQSQQANFRPMSLAEKIFVHHIASGCPDLGVQEGDVITVAVDWVVTSEAGWFVCPYFFGGPSLK